MKKKRSLISEIFNQVAVLLVLAAALIYLWGQRAALQRLGPLSFLRYGLYLALVLYLLLAIDAIRSLSSAYLFKRYDPADPESLKDLAKLTRYQAFPPNGNLEGVKVLVSLLHDLKAAGFREVSRQSFGIVMENTGVGQQERFILIYKPMLNVLIADRHLKEAAAYVLQAKTRIRRNAILLISDMESDTEMLSSAVSAVNYLPKLSSRCVLVPYILDIRHGRLFYPQDKSEQNLQDRHYYRQQRQRILQHSLHPNVSTGSGAGSGAGFAPSSSPSQARPQAPSSGPSPARPQAAKPGPAASPTRPQTPSPNASPARSQMPSPNASPARSQMPSSNGGPARSQTSQSGPAPSRAKAPNPGPGRSR